MADTNFIAGQQIPLAWIQDVNNAVYRGLGVGGVVPTTLAQTLANIGAAAQQGNSQVTFNVATATQSTHATPLAQVQQLIAAAPSTGVSSFNTRTGAVTLTSSDVTGALGYTPANSTSGVSSFNTRTGAVTLTSSDVTGALGYTPPANPMTTSGDLIVGGTGGAETRLGVGSAGQVLSVVSGAPAWTTLSSSAIATIKDYGASTTNTAANNAAAISNALSAVVRPFVPQGVYSTSYASGNAFSGALSGLGQIATADGNKHGFNFSTISAAPAAFGTWASVDQALNGDLSHVGAVYEHRIVGASTLTTGSTGYFFTQEAYGILNVFYNSSGTNQSSTTDDGRTMAAHNYTKIQQSGQGDCSAFVVQGVVTSQNQHTTSWLTSPAISSYVSDLYAGASGQYLNPFENHITDNGYDVSGVGYETALIRSFSGTPSLGNSWVGVIVQSQGSAPIDAAYTAQGPAKIGIDFTQLSLTQSGNYVNAAIVLAPNQRIYGGGSTTPNGTSALYTSTTNLDFFYDSPGTGWIFAINNASSFIVGNGMCTTTTLKVTTATPGATGSVGSVIFGGTYTSTATGGSASPLPSAPFTYLCVVINGVVYKIPVYAN